MLVSIKADAAIPNLQQKPHPAFHFIQVKGGSFQFVYQLGKGWPRGLLQQNSPGASGLSNGLIF